MLADFFVADALGVRFMKLVEANVIVLLFPKKSFLMRKGVLLSRKVEKILLFPQLPA